MKTLIKGLFLILGLMPLTVMAEAQHIDLQFTPKLVFEHYALHSLIYAGNYHLKADLASFRFELHLDGLCAQYDSKECAIVKPLIIVPHHIEAPGKYCEISEVVAVLRNSSPQFLPMTVKGHGGCQCTISGNTLQMQC